jgi:hypothetical protein
MEPTLIPLHPDSTLTRVLPELYARGNVYAALDQRRTFLILSQKLTYTQSAIADLALEECAIASLYEAADPTHRTSKCGSFRVERMILAEAPAWVEQHRKPFSKVYIATTEPRRWKTETDEEE